MTIMKRRILSQWPCIWYDDLAIRTPPPPPLKTSPKFAYLRWTPNYYYVKLVSSTARCIHSKNGFSLKKNLREKRINLDVRILCQK